MKRVGPSRDMQAHGGTGAVVCRAVTVRHPNAIPILNVDDAVWADDPACLYWSLAEPEAFER